jgi:hypothetical protein
MYHAELRKSL